MPIERMLTRFFKFNNFPGRFWAVSVLAERIDIKTDELDFLVIGRVLRIGRDPDSR